LVFVFYVWGVCVCDFGVDDFDVVCVCDVFGMEDEDVTVVV